MDYLVVVVRFIVHCWNKDSYNKLVELLQTKGASLGIRLLSKLPQLNTVVVEMDPDKVGKLYSTGLVRLIEASYPFGLESV